MQKPCATVIIPTYNEEGNIGRMIEYLSANIFPLISDWEMKMLVVDGSSTDATEKLVAERSKVYPNIFLYKEEKKEGIGAAYMKGFKYAIEKMSADVVIEFDSDFQHPPETIPELLREIENGYDYVVGSRALYKGDNVRKGIFRKFLTNFGGWSARLILFFPGRLFLQVTDPTTGLKATRVKGLEGFLLREKGDLYSQAFGYKVQLLSEILRSGAKYKEIPLNFQNRTAGESKFVFNTISDILLSCVKTRYRG